MTLAQAFKHSAVPIYRSLTSEVGPQTLQAWLTKFEYGNRDISSGIDQFWLNGSLQISALEQLEFLKNLLDGELGASVEVLAILREMMLVESTPDYQLYAKTGAGYLDDGSALGWYVGWIDNTEGRYYFALNTSASGFAEVQKKRLAIAQYYLESIKDAQTSDRAD